MKNVKRLLILITLIFFASKVLFSDIDIFHSEHETESVANLE